MIQRLPPSAGRLGIGLVDGCSTVLTALAGDPQRLLLPRHRGPAVWAYQGNYGGGLLAGDLLHLDVDLAAGTRLMLGTQASTKIFRSDDGRPAQQGLHAHCGPGSVLLAVPDPVCTFAGARYQQDLYIDLAGDASLLLLDWCTAGRSGRDAAWAADYRSRTRISTSGSTLIDERIHLTGDAGQPWAGMRILASLWLLGPALAPMVARLLPLATAPLSGEVLESVSPLRGGCVWRLAGSRTEPVLERVHGLLDGLQELADGRPWRRRP